MQKAQPSPTASSLPPSPNRLQEQQQLLSFSLLQNAQSEYAEPNKLKQMEVRPGQVLLSSHCDVSVALQIHRELQLFGFGFFFFLRQKQVRDVHLWVWLLERHSPHHHLLFNLHQDALPACNTATVLATAKPSVLYPTTQNPEVSTSLRSHKMVQSVHSVLAALRSSRDVFSQRPAGLAERWHQTCSGSQAVLRRQILGRNSHSSHQAQMNSRTRRWVCLNRHHIS